MQAVEILDNYRHPLASDRLGTIVLSSFLRSGALSEGELQDQISTDAFDARKKVDQLFRASLLELAPADRFRLTDLGKAVLSSFGITTAAVQALLDAFALPAHDRLLLSRFVEAFDESTSHTSSLISLLRTATAVTKMDSRYFERHTSLARYLRATVVGLSPAAALLDSAALCHSMARWTNLIDQESDTARLRSLTSKPTIWACEQAKLDVQRSNSYFILGERGQGKTSVLIKYLSQTRVLSALSSGYLDSQLHLLYHSGHGAESVAKMLTDTKFLFTCRQVLKTEGFLSGTEEPAAVADYARRRLARIVVFDTPAPSPPLNRNKALESCLSRANAAQSAQPLVDRLRAIVDALSTKELGAVESAKLKSTLEDLRRILRKQVPQS
ncbi:hypothetical protein [Pseudaquabacterium pictum]|uniref:Uncharacterized protein n=1 Tax=Pseudaquabacterium pictum TaxID=2315236 RepID=A0A480ASX8_9BURK|nr:hypothetical protein [Rubrivivax pictus]GCL64501.1 hypothetical protein AQPW35_35820 [Rubrivivax pictus]